MIVQSIIDTDLYKFTTSYAYFKVFPQAEGTFIFHDREQTRYDESFVERLHNAFADLEQLRLRDEEFHYMVKSCRFIPQNYFEWLKSFHFEADKIKIWLDEEQHLHIEVTDFMYKVTLYEIAVLSTVSALRNEHNEIDLDEVVHRLKPKIELSNREGILFSDFGTRRRFSFEVHKATLEYIKANAMYCNGTSNCYLAMMLDMKPIGTYPHELPMFIAAVNGGPRQANYLAMEEWVKVYDGYLGIALTDSFGSEVFFKNFSKKHASLFDGVRQDSGDPLRFIDMTIARYNELGIDPMTKTIIFSDSLDFPRAAEIKKACDGRIRCSFGIGTNITNDTGYKPCNIVMKLYTCRMNSKQQLRKCVKLSDVPGKAIGDAREVDLYRRLLE